MLGITTKAWATLLRPCCPADVTQARRQGIDGLLCSGGEKPWWSLCDMIVDVTHEKSFPLSIYFNVCLSQVKLKKNGCLGEQKSFRKPISLPFI